MRLLGLTRRNNSCQAFGPFWWHSVGQLCYILCDSKSDKNWDTCVFSVSLCNIVKNPWHSPRRLLGKRLLNGMNNITISSKSVLLQSNQSPLSGGPWYLKPQQWQWKDCRFSAFDDNSAQSLSIYPKRIRCEEFELVASKYTGKEPGSTDAQPPLPPPPPHLREKDEMGEAWSTQPWPGFNSPIKSSPLQVWHGTMGAQGPGSLDSTQWSPPSLLWGLTWATLAWPRRQRCGRELLQWPAVLLTGQWSLWGLGMIILH